MALNLGIAGDPGGVSVRSLESSLSACLTVIVCLKSNGNDICPGSRFSSWEKKKNNKLLVKKFEKIFFKNVFEI